MVQASAVVLANGDARILALAGGRLLFREKPAAFTDLNRATSSRRQAGSAMKPLVYFAAFRRGAGLDSEVLDDPVAVPMGSGRLKWIRNYDGTFRGPIALLIAGIKAVLVILYFMHVKYSTRLTWVVVIASFFWLALLFVLTLTDYLSRPYGVY